MWQCVMYWQISLLTTVKIFETRRIVTIKSEIWFLSHCWGLDYEAMVCGVCFVMLAGFVNQEPIYVNSLWARGLNLLNTCYYKGKNKDRINLQFCICRDSWDVPPVPHHTMDLLWEKFQWILPLYMKPISFQSKASVVCSVTAAIFIGFCMKKVNVFSQHIGKKTREYLNSAEQITKNWNVDQLSMLITSWDII